MPRILRAYPKEAFIFTNNFLRVAFPATEQVTPQVTPQVERVVMVISGEMSREEIQEKLGLADKKNYVRKYQKPAIEQGIIELTIPDKPSSSLQKYRLTPLGLALQRTLK